MADLVRLLRRRQRMTQRSVALVSGVPRDDLIKIEAARCGDVKVERVRRVLDALGGRARVTAWYNGATADRLLDERHAALLERAIVVLAARHWDTSTEVTFNDYGDRGSIDLLAAHVATRHVLVGEVKASFGSLEETNRSLDVKVRLAPKIARDRLGWAPTAVSRVLIVPADRTIRRIVERHSQTFAAVYPARSREFRLWLRHPDRSIAAAWFLTEVADGNLMAGNRRAG